MKDSRKPSLPPQVKPRGRVEFDLEPTVKLLLEQGHFAERGGAMLAITAVATRMFPHWTVLDDPARGLYAIAVNPKVLARLKRRG